jgi:hypothetical protein
LERDREEKWKRMEAMIEKARAERDGKKEAADPAGGDQGGDSVLKKPKEEKDQEETNPKDDGPSKNPPNVTESDT